MHGIATVYEHSVRSSIWLDANKRQETFLYSTQFEIQQAKRRSSLRSARQQSINRKQGVRSERLVAKSHIHSANGPPYLRMPPITHHSERVSPSHTAATIVTCPWICSAWVVAPKRTRKNCKLAQRLRNTTFDCANNSVLAPG